MLSNISKQTVFLRDKNLIPALNLTDDESSPLKVKFNDEGNEKKKKNFCGLSHTKKLVKNTA